MLRGLCVREAVGVHMGAGSTTGTGVASCRSRDVVVGMLGAHRYAVSGATLDASGTAEALDAVSPTSFDALLSNPVATDANSVSKLLRGPKSLGTLLSAAYATVPSAANPGPAGGNYFSGGHTTRLWGVAASATSPDAAAVDAVQFELPQSIRFGGTAAHEAWGAAAAGALTDFFTAALEVSLADDAGCPAGESGSWRTVHRAVAWCHPV